MDCPDTHDGDVTVCRGAALFSRTDTSAPAVAAAGGVAVAAEADERAGKSQPATQTTNSNMKRSGRERARDTERPRGVLPHGECGSSVKGGRCLAYRCTQLIARRK